MTEPINGQIMSIDAAQVFYQRSRPSILAIIRRYRDIEGDDAVLVTKQGATITGFVPTIALHMELQRRKK